MKYLPLALLWIAWATLHSLMVSHWVTHLVKKKFGHNYDYYRILYNAVALTTFIPLWAFSESLDSKLIIVFNPPWHILQDALLAFSSIILIWSFRQFDFLEFLGLRQFMPKCNCQVKLPAPAIITKGPYRLVRHPVYFGLLIFIWSLDATRAEFITRIILSIYILIGCLLEEHKLVDELGTAYQEYQKRVPMLIPFLNRFWPSLWSR
ncbi:hypothetical protein SPSYN_02537 [Sporotomaculum syntrophicum]|uniref:Methanethiol S-methyltransferase n=1 Tax=Sporotomaculum syntrophicum TaxID=182264 RepID=A0A9D2WPW7_9FIRM|nr:methyltransferase [Sporotomaculum syntrophicum]KAF1084751.1 hypothetical protein SPSYN_02537 [Sporotomaculum syntrophicum]